MTTTSASSDESTNVQLGHAYDGIREYDNPLPAWWKWIFAATIIIAPFYMMYFHSGASGRSVQDQFQLAFDENMKLKYNELTDVGTDSESIRRFMNDDKWVSVGRSIFKANCVSCHGADGGGNVGPNLCDDNYKHIKSLQDIYKVVNEGVAGGAMPAWATRLGHKNDLVMVSAYVASLRGTTPASPKAPDGAPIAPW